jgi:hypothetical protein
MPVQPRAYGAAASSTEWPAPPQAMRGHSDRQQVDGAAADKQWSTWGRLSQRRPSESYPGPARAPAAKRHVLGRLGPRARSGCGRWGHRSWRVKELGQHRAVLTGRAQQVSFSPSRTPRAGPAPRHPATPPKGCTQRRSAACRLARVVNPADGFKRRQLELYNQA